MLTGYGYRPGKLLTTFLIILLQKKLKKGVDKLTAIWYNVRVMRGKGPTKLHKSKSLTEVVVCGPPNKQNWTALPRATPNFLVSS